MHYNINNTYLCNDGWNWLLPVCHREQFFLWNCSVALEIQFSKWFLQNKTRSLVCSRTNQLRSGKSVQVRSVSLHYWSSLWIKYCFMRSFNCDTYMILGKSEIPPILVLWRALILIYAYCIRSFGSLPLLLSSNAIDTRMFGCYIYLKAVRSTAVG